MDINWIFVIVLIVLIEGFSILFRFKFGWRSKHLKQKLKISPKMHHMFFGFAFLVFGWYYRFTIINLWGPVSLFDLGIALTVSDMIHHFIVLKLIKGDTEFPE
ncbi:hypothetical protein ISS04_04595 [Candidatus Woesearchaeota archaeon]|nr:hypothetical protein [Candidatus Woesearchaeota archaeon]